MGDFILKMVGWAIIIGAVLSFFDLFFILFTGKSMKYSGKKEEEDWEDFMNCFLIKKTMTTTKKRKTNR